jgi:hypothetical protein
MKPEGKPVVPIMPLLLPVQDSILGGTMETPGGHRSFAIRQAIPELPDSTCTDDTLHADVVQPFSLICRWPPHDNIYFASPNTWNLLPCQRLLVPAGASP